MKEENGKKLYRSIVAGLLGLLVAGGGAWGTWINTQVSHLMVKQAAQEATLGHILRTLKDIRSDLRKN